MNSINPKYVMALALVVALAGGLKLMNPNRKYSSREFWQSATVESVAQVPDKALLIRNKNGSVLMWAAMYNKNSGIIEELLAQGADAKEKNALGQTARDLAIEFKNQTAINSLSSILGDTGNWSNKTASE